MEPQKNYKLDVVALNVYFGLMNNSPEMKGHVQDCVNSFLSNEKNDRRMSLLIDLKLVTEVTE